MVRTYQYKVYPNTSQAKCIERWMGICCWLFNRCLEMRQKSYRRRGESVTFYQQSALLTLFRARMDFASAVPLEFERDALRRVDRGMKAFFRRVKAGQKPGFPRFKRRDRYRSMECLETGMYLRGDKIRVPLLGLIRCRGQRLPEGTQKGLRVIKRASGWYAQIILDDGQKPPEKRVIESAIGIDVGLEHFATTSGGGHIANPRFGRKSARKLRAVHRRVSRRKKGSKRRRKAVKALQRHYEQVADQRRNFCHEHSTALVKRYDLIAVENLNVSGMSRSRFGKSILDAAWSTFIAQLASKAESAGSQVVLVNPHGTSQECPDCGRVKSKKLSERRHECECGYRCQRDHAAARVILSRAVGVSAATRTWTDSASGPALVALDQADRMKRVART